MLVPTRCTPLRPLILGIAVLACSGFLLAEEPRTFTCLRKVTIPRESGKPRVVVTEFLTHGELQPDGSNLAVYDFLDRLVPWRVLQAGPGDLCRVAFQTVPQQSEYKITYGGKVTIEKVPPWTASAGLLLETRRWKPCDLKSLKSVREAFTAAEPLGSDYVPGVFHRHNPFWPAPEPFLSTYRGTLQIEDKGAYEFFTSSQDCSFLLIDGEEVVSAPGSHGPVGDARIKGTITLHPGPHAFEYVHAAGGPDACMVAAWRPPKANQPEAIPASVFGSDAVVHLPAGTARHSTRGTLRDFTVEELGEVPLADSDIPLVRVQFKELPPRAGGSRPKCHWDFGDGQGTDDAEPTHVYLHPGLYVVGVANPSGASPLTTFRIQIHRALVGTDPKKEPDKLPDYLPLLNSVIPAKLDPLGVLQLVKAHDQAGQYDKVVKVGKSWLLAKRTAEDGEVVYPLARLVAPTLRDHLDDAAGALVVWQAARECVGREDWKTSCEVEAADIALNEMHQRGEAKLLLEAATARTIRVDDPAIVSKLHRVWGDWHARGGDKPAAQAAYHKAESCLHNRGSSVEQQARRGAFSRSTEAFLRDKELDRAREELHDWQDQFPTDKVEGYLPLLQGRFFVARGKLQHAIVVAGDLTAVNPDSPYADQLVFLAAECEEKLGRTDRALASYQTLVTDYPGSPLVKAARQKLSQPPAKPPKR